MEDTEKTAAAEEQRASAEQEAEKEKPEKETVEIPGFSPDEPVRKLDTMDDLRAAMNDPEVKKANREYSKKYLKANRPKSLALVFCMIALLFVVLESGTKKVSLITPSAFRTADTIQASVSEELTDPVTLTSEQRSQILDILSNVQVASLFTMDDQELPETYYYFSCGSDGKWFAVDPEGTVYTDGHTYSTKGDNSASLYSDIGAVLGI